MSSPPVREPREDKDITQAVYDAFFLDPELDRHQFKVKTVDGVVYLSGFAASDQEMQRAVDVALAVEGVKDVVNQIVVGGRPPVP
ncbi:MAG: BON domain-containing protein [Candidatus Methylomirabilis oxyfera]|nr:BON domain-containing protein [Candidatus Methylomirabilis oxyfera]